jgi:tRNA G18 (ribose-2'-O)-methylase SpoU
LPSRLALVVGNEGAGLTPQVDAAVIRRVRIPMSPTVESLNVAAATAILLWALRPPVHD